LGLPSNEITKSFLPLMIGDETIAISVIIRSRSGEPYHKFPANIPLRFKKKIGATARAVHGNI